MVSVSLALHFIDVLAGFAGFNFPTPDLSSFCVFCMSFPVTSTALTHQLDSVSRALPRRQHVDVGLAGLVEFDDR